MVVQGAAREANANEPVILDSRQVLNTDLAAWADHAFERRVHRERFDRQGQSVWSERYRFAVSPSPQGPRGLGEFVEDLLEINGRAPTAAEIAQHKRARRFERHYRDLRVEKLTNPFGEDLPLLPLLYEHEYRADGLMHNPDGSTCRRFVFDAEPEVADMGSSDQLLAATRGFLCLAPGDHLAMAQVETVRPVKRGLVQLLSLSLLVRCVQVGEHWLPEAFETTIDLKLPFDRQRKSNRYSYSQHSKVR